MPVDLKILGRRVRIKELRSGERIDGSHAVSLCARHHRRQQAAKLISEPRGLDNLDLQFGTAYISSRRDVTKLVAKSGKERLSALAHIGTGKKLDQFQKLRGSKRATRFVPPCGQKPIRRCAEQQDRRWSGRAFRFQKRLEKWIGVLFV
jgi:hypothetical protein